MNTTHADQVAALDDEFWWLPEQVDTRDSKMPRRYWELVLADHTSDAATSAADAAAIAARALTDAHDAAYDGHHDIADSLTKLSNALQSTQ